MRLVSFNLLHGRSLDDGLVDRDRLHDAARDLDADVVGLQEVDRGLERSHRLDQTAVVAGGLAAADYRFEPALHGTPGETWHKAEGAPAGAGGSYGVGLVSRWPVRAWHVVHLSAARVRSPIRLPGSGQVVWLQDEPRVGLAAVVEGPFGPMTVATTHLSFVPGWNVVQLRRLVRGLRTLPSPQVLLGDLNLPGPVPRWASGWRPLAAVATYPAAQPSWQLDHVLGRGPLPPVTRVEARQMPLSDHRALLVELAEPLPAG